MPHILLIFIHISSYQAAMRSSLKEPISVIMKTIIVQENDSAVLDVLTHALTSQGHRTVGILGDCPKEMSATILENKPSLILMDYRSTTESSSILLKAIRKITTLVPVLGLSCEFNLEKLSTMVGLSGFLAKPFDLDELFSTVDGMMKIKLA